MSFPCPLSFPTTGQGLSGCPGPPGPLRAPRAVWSLLHLPSPSLFKSHRAHHASPVCQLSHSSNYALRLRRRSSSLSQHQTDTWEAASCPTAHTQPRPVPPHPHRAGLWQEPSPEPCDTKKIVPKSALWRGAIVRGLLRGPRGKWVRAEMLWVSPERGQSQPWGITVELRDVGRSGRSGCNRAPGAARPPPSLTRTSLGHPKPSGGRFCTHHRPPPAAPHLCGRPLGASLGSWSPPAPGAGCGVVPGGCWAGGDGREAGGCRGC